MENKKGGRFPPCRTHIMQGKNADVPSAHFTRDLIFWYNLNEEEAFPIDIG